MTHPLFRRIFRRIARWSPSSAASRPDEAEAIGEALYEGGIRIIEVPLNSPDPLDSIEQLAKRLGDRGAGRRGHGARRRPGRARSRRAGGQTHRFAQHQCRRHRGNRRRRAGLLPRLFHARPRPSPRSMPARMRSSCSRPRRRRRRLSRRSARCCRRTFPLLVVGSVTARHDGAWLDGGRQWLRTRLGRSTSRARRPPTRWRRGARLRRRRWAA